MPSDFQWQTEDDGWEEKPAQQAKVERPKKRPWFRISLALLIVVIIGAVIYRQVQQQLEAAVTQAEIEVRRTHELVLQAADGADRDLLNNLVSGRDNDWLHQTLEVAGEGSLFNPQSFGLVSKVDNSAQYEFDLSPDLNQAEVITTRNFTNISPGGTAETVQLKQYAIYRRGNNRWLFAPPEDPESYWGETVTKEGQYLNVIYPEIDAEQVNDLFQYIEDKLDQLCTEAPDLSCPADFNLTLTLETDPASQLGLKAFQAELENRPEIVLPTLSLVGYPVDQASANALYRGYAAHVVQAGMINALELECCEHALLIHALLDYQLTELDLRPYPLNPADYEQLFGRFQQIHTLDDVWRSREFDLEENSYSAWAYALTDFILSTSISNATAETMRQSLIESNSYPDWLNELLVDDFLDVKVQQAWLNYIYGSSSSGQVVQAQTVPEQDILLSCEQISSPRTVLYGYDWSSEDWLTLDEYDQPTQFIDTLPDDSAVIIQRGNFDGPKSTFLWQNGLENILYNDLEQDPSKILRINSIGPNGRNLFMLNFAQDNQTFAILDLEDCDETGCQLKSISGFPEWSPDSSQMILQLFGQTEERTSSLAGITRIDRAGNFHPLSAQGFSPFWFSKEEYGYVEIGRNPGIYTAQVANDEPQLLINDEDLRQAIPEDERPETLVIRDAQLNPTNNNLIAITAFNTGVIDNNIYFFRWNRLSGETVLLAFLERVVVGFSEWLPSGEWLLVPTFQNQRPGGDSTLPWSYYLFNIDPTIAPFVVSRSEFSGFDGLDYSFDGKWLISPNVGFLELVNLSVTTNDNLPYRQMLPYQFNDCREALFIW